MSDILEKSFPATLPSACRPQEKGMVTLKVIRPSRPTVTNEGGYLERRFCWTWKIEIPGLSPFVGSDLSTPFSDRTPEEMMSTLIGFMEADKEKYEYRMRGLEPSDDYLFGEIIAEFAYLNDGELLGAYMDCTPEEFASEIS